MKYGYIATIFFVAISNIFDTNIAMKYSLLNPIFCKTTFIAKNLFSNKWFHH